MIQEYNWKNLALLMLTAIRVVFLATVTWDFFLTLITKASQRSLALTGVGAVYAPFIIIPWAAAIFILAALLFDRAFRDWASITKYGYIIYVFFIILYLSLAILAYINPLVSWPLIFNFVVNAIWSGVIMYFRCMVSNGNIQDKQK
jgi:hypothetical protein